MVVFAELRAKQIRQEQALKSSLSAWLLMQQMEPIHNKSIQQRIDEIKAALADENN